jgi:NADP-dependent 3-hydroxy acid dehydrogenase YdfG
MKLGAAVAREVAAQGARVFLSGRTPPHVQLVADEISRQGGRIAVAQVDALDERAVNSYVDKVVEPMRTSISTTMLYHRLRREMIGGYPRE